ncbi:MAG: Holliday junction branch migration protein RuvA [Elusimicrobia bacterium]|nr:Holliday junction branch migration protein RuvA [Elusimicrobiota bacterium]
MIASLRGVVAAKDMDMIVLECGGVGHEVHVTTATASQLPAPGGETFLLVVPSYAMYGGGETLYGFLSPAEKAMFCVLREEIPGTGAKKALEYLDKASKSLPDFRRAVMDRDEKLLCAVFGFTKKTATKIVDALKGKLEEVRVSGSPHLQKAADGIPPARSWSQALNALEALGYKSTEARLALQTLAEEESGRDIPAEDLVRQALKRL